MLGNGDILSAGGKSVSNSSVENLYPSGLGPDLKGLFYQSNLGIIIEATIKLIPKESMIGVISFEKEHNTPLSEFVDFFAKLKKRNLLPDNIHISNKNRKRSVLIPLLKKYVALNHAEAIKTCELEIDRDYYASCSLQFDEEILDIIFSVIEKEARGIAKVHLRKESTLDKQFEIFDKATKGIFSHSLGIPNDDAILSLAFNEVNLINPKQLENFKTGTFFIVPVLPFTGDDVTTIDNLIDDIFSKEGFTPFITFNLIEHYCLEAVINLIFNSESEQERLNAKSTMLNAFKTLVKNGYPPQRMSIFQTPHFENYDTHHINFIKRTRELFDPNNVISPERYGL